MKKNIFVTLSFLMPFVIVFFALFFIGAKDTPAAATTWLDSGNYTVAFEGGTGEENSPYIIANAKQLAGMAYRVNNSSAYRTKYYELKNNIDLAGHDWIPIGNSNCIFSGHFNGNGKVVYNMNITRDYNSSGLFGYSSGTIISVYVQGKITGSAAFIGGVVGFNVGNISNITSNTNIVVKVDAIVGGIAGCSNSKDSVIDKCIFLGSISAPGSCGGIVGYLLDGKVKNCYNTASISGTENVGGICGYFIESTYEGSIDFCYNKGDIAGITNVGGIAGQTESNMAENSTLSVSNCVNYGAIQGTSFVAGVIGQFKGNNLTNLVNKGNISASGENVGGISGKTMFAGQGQGRYLTNLGKVKGQNLIGGISGASTLLTNSAGAFAYVFNSGDIEGEKFVGGIIGSSQSDIVRAGNQGNIKANGDYAGGICGESTHLISYAYNEGNISAQKNVGGIVGEQRDGGMLSNYNTGDITATATSGYSFCGGIAGVIDSDLIAIFKCYTIGKIKVTQKGYVGAVIGRNVKDKGAIEDNYFWSNCFSSCKALGTKDGKGVNEYRIVVLGKKYKNYPKSLQELSSSDFVDSSLNANFIYNSSGYPTLKDVTYSGYEVDFVKDSSIWGLDTNINGSFPYLLDKIW